jgi:hypothetical protein
METCAPIGARHSLLAIGRSDFFFFFVDPAQLGTYKRHSVMVCDPRKSGPRRHGPAAPYLDRDRGRSPRDHARSGAGSEAHRRRPIAPFSTIIDPTRARSRPRNGAAVARRGTRPRSGTPASPIRADGHPSRWARTGRDSDGTANDLSTSDSRLRGAAQALDPAGRQDQPSAGARHPRSRLARRGRRTVEGIPGPRRDRSSIALVLRSAPLPARAGHGPAPGTEGPSSMSRRLPGPRGPFAPCGSGAVSRPFPEE